MKSPRVISQSDICREIIVGSLQGDAYCQRGPWPKSNCRIQFSQTNKDYIYFIYSFFSSFCTAPHKIKPNEKSMSRKGFENTQPTYKFYTPMNPIFNEYRENVL